MRSKMRPPYRPSSPAVPPPRGSGALQSRDDSQVMFSAACVMERGSASAASISRSMMTARPSGPSVTATTRNPRLPRSLSAARRCSHSCPDSVAPAPRVTATGTTSYSKTRNSLTAIRTGPSATPPGHLVACPTASLAGGRIDRMPPPGVRRESRQPRKGLQSRPAGGSVRDFGQRGCVLWPLGTGRGVRFGFHVSPLHRTTTWIVSREIGKLRGGRAHDQAAGVPLSTQGSSRREDRLALTRIAGTGRVTAAGSPDRRTPGY